MDSSINVRFFVGLSILTLVLARVSYPSTEETSEEDDDYQRDDEVVVDNYVTTVDADRLSSKEKLDEFNRFLKAATRHEDKPTALFLRPLSRFDIRSSEERLKAAAQSRAMFFRGSPKGRRVPLKMDHLLPDKCESLPFDLTVSHTGCENATVRTNFCYGLCSSLFVPLHDDVIATCNSCAPTEFKNVVVQLRCPEREHSVRKHVKVVTACGCIGCDSKGGVFG